MALLLNCRQIEPDSIIFRDRDSLQVFLISWGSACFCADAEAATTRRSSEALLTSVQKRSAMSTDMWHVGLLLHALLHSQLAPSSGSACGASLTEGQGVPLRPFVCMLSRCSSSRVCFTTCARHTLCAGSTRFERMRSSPERLRMLASLDAELCVPCECAEWLAADFNACCAFNRVQIQLRATAS